MFQFQITINSDGTLTFANKVLNEFKDSFSPYLKALEDKIIIVDGGKVRQYFSILLIFLLPLVNNTHHSICGIYNTFILYRKLQIAVTMVQRVQEKVFIHGIT